jgi:signal transduction histidine kinase
MRQSNNKLHAEIKQVMDRYWACYLNGDLEGYASLIDTAFKLIGTTDEEVIEGSAEVLAWLAGQGDVAGKAELRNKQTSCFPIDDLVLVHEFGHGYALVDQDWMFYAKIRVSSILRQDETGWKLIQQHGSLPDSRANEGETLGFEFLSQENLQLKEAVQRRTLELEIKNRELEKTLHDLRLTQKQLIQSEKMASLGELTAGIAHEIQNPLNFVNNFSEVSMELLDEMNEEMENGDLDEAKAIAHDLQLNLKKINHHGQRADAILKGMLQHSRKSAGEKTPTDINKLADEYLRLAYHGLRAKEKSFNATLHTDFDPALEPLLVIPQEMGRVLLNLITNAFYTVHEKKKSKGADFQPVVTIRTRKFSDHVTIAVTDNGNGIPQQVLDKIFQPFFTTKPTGEGTGLGLSVSYDIVKAHGGEITVKSQVREGTEFAIILPINTE